MKIAEFETHSSYVNQTLADSVQMLQAEIDQTMDRSVGLYLTAYIAIGVVIIASLQWTLNLPPFAMLALTLLYLAGIFGFSLLKLYRAIRKAECLSSVLNAQ